MVLTFLSFSRGFYSSYDIQCEQLRVKGLAQEHNSRNLAKVGFEAVTFGLFSQCLNHLYTARFMFGVFLKCNVLIS